MCADTEIPAHQPSSTCRLKQPGKSKWRMTDSAWTSSTTRCDSSPIHPPSTLVPVEPCSPGSSTATHVFALSACPHTLMLA